MLAVLNVADEIVIAFFSAAIMAQSVVIGVLWKRVTKCEDERIAGKPTENHK